MRTETVTESKKAQLSLTEDQAEALRRIGRQLASDRRWWGASDELEGSNEDSEAQSQATRTVIRCESTASGEYMLTVDNAIGVIGLSDLQITVKPKIPLPHFLHLITESEYLPRPSEDPARLEQDDNFFTLIAQWFVSECEYVLRRGLTRDYHKTTADLPTARGRVDSLRTTRSILVGRVKVRCRYDNFGNDSSLNRLLNHALSVIQQKPVFRMEVRRRARRAQERFDGVGEYRPADLNASTDGNTKHYRDAVTLARMLLSSQGTSTLHGPSPGGTFLFRTPEAVEEGIRRVLKKALHPNWDVEKKGLTLSGASRRTLNPDLVFNPSPAIGDVKYRLSSTLKRSDINQVTTFAAGFKASKGIVIEFDSKATNDYVEVGDIRIDAVSWDIDQSDPDMSAEKLAADIRAWLSTPHPE